MKNIVYRISSNIPFTKNLTKKIEANIRLLYPSNNRSIINKVNDYLIKLYFSAFIMLVGLYMFADVSIYYSVIAGIVIYVVITEKIDEDYVKLENKLLKQLLMFIEDIKFRFQFDGMLEQSLLDSIGDAEYEMSVHGQKLYECLIESYYHDRQEYIDISPNHFFLTFYSLCEAVMLYGDKKSNNGSIFLKNLGYLKEEINVELLKRNKIHSNFIGLKGMTIIPLFLIKPIEIWAVYNIPELADTYNKGFGIYSTLFLGLISVLLYKIINLLKNGKNKGNPSVYIKRLIDVPWIDRLIRGFISVNIKSCTKINNILREVGYEYNIKEYTLKRILTSIYSGIVAAILISNIEVHLGSDSYGLYAMISFFSITFIVYILNGVVLKIKKALLLLEREEEIVRFQNIILMMMHMDKVTIEQIITELERFARAFKGILERISDKYTYKGKDVFIEAKMEANFRPFERLMDGFIACDNTYISEAFDDLKKDRRYFLDRHKQENERMIEDKTTIAKLLSFMPLCAVIIVKLIIPFVIYGMSSLQDINMTL